MTSYRSTSYEHHNQDEIEKLLVGHKVVKVADDTLELDNGQILRFEGNEGRSCGSGDYPLTELNGTDNIITSVEFINDPDDDDEDDRDSEGVYQIFVFADNKKVNLATFAGTDGNSCYGTGYTIHVNASEIADR